MCIFKRNWGYQCGVQKRDLGWVEWELIAYKWYAERERNSSLRKIATQDHGILLRTVLGSYKGKGRRLVMKKHKSMPVEKVT